MEKDFQFSEVFINIVSDVTKFIRYFYQDGIVKV